MRLDKFLKVSRLVKRRPVAKEAAADGYVLINDRVAKPGSDVKVGDILTIRFSYRTRYFEVLSVQEHASKQEAPLMFREIVK